MLADHLSQLRPRPDSRRAQPRRVLRGRISLLRFPLHLVSPDRRSQAIQQLRKAGSPYAEIAGLRRFKKGEKGSTFPVANAAAALLRHAGRCWLAAEIAVIGAASPLRNGYTRAPGTEALGPAGHPATLIEQTRVNRGLSELVAGTTHCRRGRLGIGGMGAGAVGDRRGPVIDELFSELARPSANPRTAAACPEDLRPPPSESGYLDRRIVTAEGATGLLAEMLAFRHAKATVPRKAAPESAHTAEAAETASRSRPTSEVAQGRPARYIPLTAKCAPPVAITSRTAESHPAQR